jgi:hypothetical protein
MEFAFTREDLAHSSEGYVYSNIVRKLYNKINNLHVTQHKFISFFPVDWQLNNSSAICFVYTALKHFISLLLVIGYQPVYVE